MSFQPGFTWGAAAASYQIEGAWNEDGKGPSTWDVFTHTPDRVWGGHNGDVACDHYHRYRDDVALMAEIGLQAYRLSLSWPRLIPEGVGRVNEAGLGFYDRLVDELLARGIEPWVTLLHWDYPYALHLRGGWLNPDSSDWFADYSRLVMERLSDRVSHWMTLNEPQVYLGIGHGDGTHAPGLKLPQRELLLAMHNLLLAHGKSVQAIRAHSRQPALVGFAPVGAVKQPVSDHPDDLGAAREAMFDPARLSIWNILAMSDPIFRGSHPEEFVRAAGSDMTAFTAEQLATINQPLDFYGANIYNSEPYRRGPDGRPERLRREPGFARTGVHDWPVTSDALYWGARLLHERYHLPIVITENGMSGTDWVALDGRVHDPQRIDFTHRYLHGLKRAAGEGVPVRAYFHWSLMDNFEWAQGYTHRFGLIHVDYTTQKRTLKDSAHWYRTVIETNGRDL